MNFFKKIASFLFSVLTALMVFSACVIEDPTVEVTKISIALSGDRNVNVGDSVEFTVKFTPENATNKQVDFSFDGKNQNLGEFEDGDEENVYYYIPNSNAAEQTEGKVVICATSANGIKAKKTLYVSAAAVQKTIYLKEADGTLINTIVVASDSINPSEIETPADTTAGKFGGWYWDAGCTIPVDYNDTLTVTNTFYAKRVSASTKYTVTFYYETAIVSSQTVLVGQTVTKPADPSGTGTFVGWYEKNGSTYASSAFDFSTLISRNISLFARFESSVVKVSSITINGSSTAALNGTSAYTVSVLPSDALDKTVTWSVTNGTGSATISNSGVLSATASGTVTVKATANDGSNVYATKTVEITNASTLSSIDFTLSASSVKVGSNVSVTGVTAKYSDGNSKDVTSSSTISCADSYVSINSKVIKGVAKGTATITASYTENGITKTATKSLTVNANVVVDEFDGVKILVAQSLGYDHIHYWDASNKSTYKNTTWPGVAMTAEGDDYVMKFEGTSSVSLLITTTGGNKLCADNMAITEKGTYRVTSSGAAKEEITEPTEPTVTISPTSGNIYLTSTITVTVKDNNATLTTSGATINGKSATLNGVGNTTFKVSDYVTSVGTTFTVTATATNEMGTGSANQTYKVVEKPAFDGPTEWNQLTMFQVMVSSFQHSNSGAGGYSDSYGPSGRIHNGNLQGIIDSLDYIKSLGCNALWMTPIFNSAGKNGEPMDSTGYYTYDYFNVDPKFGSNETFKTLVDECHSRGIAVILDGVVGHYSRGGAATSPNGKSPSRSNGMYQGCNYPASLDFYKEVLSYWITEYKIDGWRLDQAYQAGARTDQVYTGNTNYWPQLCAAVKDAAASNGTKGTAWGTLGYMVGEVLDGNQSNIQKWVVVNDGLQSCFDFPSRYKLCNSILGGSDWADSAGSDTFKDAMTYTYNTYTAKGYTHSQGYYPNLFFNNHDLLRFGDLIINWKKYSYGSSEYVGKYKVALAVQAAYTGPITIYYGDEWGEATQGIGLIKSLSEPVGKGAYWDNSSRTAGHIDKATSGSAAEKEVLAYTTKIMNIRKDHEAMWKGTSSVISTSSSDLFATKKTSGGETIYVAINNGTSANSFSLPQAGTDLITGKSYSGTVSVPALSAVYILAN